MISNKKLVIFTLNFFLLMLFTSCVSEIHEIESEHESIYPPKICCVHSDFSKIERTDSLKKTRGWGGLDPNAEFTPTTYPLDALYLMTKKGRKYESLRIPVQRSGESTYIDICYKADAEGNVYAMSEGKSMKVGDPVGPDGSILAQDTKTVRKCFFSSTPDVPSKLTPAGAIKTPGGTATYEPYGDRLFRSEDYCFSYEIDDNDNMSIQSIKHKDLAMGIYPQPVEYSLTSLPMYRATLVIVPRLIICDGYPDPEEETSKGGTYELKKDTLIKRLGNMEDWGIRFFLAGKKDGPLKKGYPAEIRIDYLNSGYNGYIIGQTSNANIRGIVALTENELNLRPMEQQLTSVGGKKFNYIGFGVHDSSFPFIYRGDIFLQYTDLCCSIYRHDPETKEIIQAETIRLPLNDMSINDIHLLNYVIDVDDLALKFGLGQKTGKSIQSFYDSDFGSIADIPAILIEEEPQPISDAISHE